MKKEIFCTELLSDYILSDKLRLLLPNSVNCRIIREFGKRANQHKICKPSFRKQFFRPLKVDILFNECGSFKNSGSPKNFPMLIANSSRIKE